MKTIKYPNNDFHCHLALSLAQLLAQFSSPILTQIFFSILTVNPAMICPFHRIKKPCLNFMDLVVSKAFLG